MNRNLIKRIPRSNKKAHTLAELLIASALVIILIASVLGSFVFTNSFYKTSVIRENFQRAAFVAMGKIIKGSYETSNPSTGMIRLAEASLYGFAKDRTEPVPPPPPGNTIYFFTLAETMASSYTNTTPYNRWFTLNSTNTSIIYHHPTSSGSIDEVIYTAPAGANITLIFWTPQAIFLYIMGIIKEPPLDPCLQYLEPYYDKRTSGNMFYGMDFSVYDNICIGIDIVISQNVRGKNITGCASTLVNVRNHAT